MKKYLLFSLIASAFLSSCGSYNTAVFYIENNSNQTVGFESSVISPNTLAGPTLLSKTFTAEPGEIVVLGETEINEDDDILELFHNMMTDSNIQNDPARQSNWVKSVDKKGKVSYTLYVGSKYIASK
jgi:hypothetical protein